MGFFSAVKRIFGGQPKQETASVEQTEPQTQETTVPGASQSVSLQGEGSPAGQTELAPPAGETEQSPQPDITDDLPPSLKEGSSPSQEASEQMPPESKAVEQGHPEQGSSMQQSQEVEDLAAEVEGKAVVPFTVPIEGVIPEEKLAGPQETDMGDAVPAASAEQAEPFVAEAEGKAVVPIVAPVEDVIPVEKSAGPQEGDMGDAVPAVSAEQEESVSVEPSSEAGIQKVPDVEPLSETVPAVDEPTSQEMGFFSAVKRIFGGQPKQETASVEPAEPQTQETAVPEAPQPVSLQGELTSPAGEAEQSPQSDITDDLIPSLREGSSLSQEASEQMPPESKAVEQGHPEQGSSIQQSQEVEDLPAEVEGKAVVPFTVPVEGVIPAEKPAGLQETDMGDAVPTVPAEQEEGVSEEVSSEEGIQDVPDAELLSATVTAVDEPISLEQEVEEKSALQVLDDADAAMLLRLREAEPRLSIWLEIILEGVEETGDELWRRLTFLLRGLEAPPEEVDSFVADFRIWLERMEYRYVEEFRSELQYRLALALDLEDEEDERSRLFLKISEGLSRTREQLSRGLDALFAGHGELTDKFWEDMEELFIMADLGYEPALELVERLKERARKAGAQRTEEVRSLLMAELEEIFRTPPRISAVNRPEVVLLIGVNGVGKTTTIAKLAHRERMQGKKVMIAAADTFRAAAIEQMQVWAERVGALFHSRPTGSDPASVAYEAMDRAVREDVDLLLVDTAGRLQTKTNLMEELGKIRQVLGKKHPGAPHRSILVLDATTGQNALSQTKLFKEAAGVDELILTKLDGTAKGGVAIAVAMQHNLPITYVGLGEKMEDLRPFNGADYARALLGEKGSSGT